MVALDRAILLALFALALPGSGCSGSRGGLGTASPSTVAPRTALVLADGHTGHPMCWGDLLSRIDGADVVILAEQHDDAVGHAVQLAVVEDVLERWPASVVALEMLERDEQPLVDDFLDGIIDAETLATLTCSTSWGGPGGWAAWYQPVIDAARDAGARVIAANAPRRYVRLARRDGFASLDKLPASRRQFVDRPRSSDDGAYWQRFRNLMSGMHDEGESDEDVLRSVFRAQEVWDATMAASIAGAAPGRNRKALLLVGQFHADFEGGIVVQLRRRLPNADVIVVSLQPDRAAADEEGEGESVPRADVIVYTIEPDAR